MRERLAADDSKQSVFFIPNDPTPPPPGYS
jgi:hypothetical protein